MRSTKKLRLSSRQTVLIKYVAPSLIIASLLFTIYLNWKLTVSMAPVGLISMYGVVVLAMGIYIYFYGSLKKVWIDDRNLYVSNFREDLKIPISNIDRVTEMKLFNPRRITIHFKRTTRFGDKIVFLGYHRQWLLFGTHPAITSIQRRIKNTSNDNHLS